MLSRTPLKTSAVVTGMEPFGHDANKSKYIEDTNIKNAYKRLNEDEREDATISPIVYDLVPNEQAMEDLVLDNKNDP
ncbi:hypothetical protein AAC387_Pa02g1815 [Persea americana]